MEDCKILLKYLIGVAQKTEGAEVWRALFASMLKEIEFTETNTTEKIEVKW